MGRSMKTEIEGTHVVGYDDIDEEVAGTVQSIFSKATSKVVEDDLGRPRQVLENDIEEVLAALTAIDKVEAPAPLVMGAEAEEGVGVAAATAHKLLHATVVSLRLVVIKSGQALLLRLRTSSRLTIQAFNEHTFAHTATIVKGVVTSGDGVVCKILDDWRSCYIPSEHCKHLTSALDKESKQSAHRVGDGLFSDRKGRCPQSLQSLAAQRTHEGLDHGLGHLIQLQRGYMEMHVVLTKEDDTLLHSWVCNNARNLGEKVVNNVEMLPFKHIGHRLA